MIYADQDRRGCQYLHASCWAISNRLAYFFWFISAPSSSATVMNEFFFCQRERNSFRFRWLASGVLTKVKIMQLRYCVKIRSSPSAIKRCKWCSLTYLVPILQLINLLLRIIAHHIMLFSIVLSLLNKNTISTLHRNGNSFYAVLSFYALLFRLKKNWHIIEPSFNMVINKLFFIFVGFIHILILQNK